ncbi:MAG: hypothetical protein ACR2IF_07350 [Terriglobales bacterium]
MLTCKVDEVLDAYCNAHSKITQAARDGLSVLLEMMVSDPDVDDVRWAAYMLATVRHECAGRWLPIEEFGKGKGRPYGQAVTVIDADGTSYVNTYYGRGFVQLTWKANYQVMGQALGLSNLLVIHPEHALEPQTAYRIMSTGMRKGLFTGKKLVEYITGGTCDYFSARRIINRLDQAATIQGYAQEFEALLNNSIPAPVNASVAAGGTP